MQAKGINTVFLRTSILLSPGERMLTTFRT
jgi:hypothetical protein